ncbi:MAG: substrate-binding domain-containing protein [Rhodospirillales bacterium]|nr:substrate-binding domain-containing protein [Rhodospirillales bacterium]MDH3792545.1 substrate-binding domain-containing protein [Rhodospirillales bacterium]MDH3914315.1 substrate-binding domain-containing protein [Rhodospirillales bacterium]MDH3918235.1 substrate-binding domain-containing protein [Rhodospirillales bacterium]MDH3970324.1 substrate-binding domain-containing protein [Rhodospirillales bacterium]
MLKKILAFAALGAALSLGLPTDATAGAVSIHGSTTVDTTLIQPYKSKIEKNSKQSLKVVANGSGSGLLDLIAGKAQIAMISAPLDAVIAKLNHKNPDAVPDGSVFVPHMVGAARVAFVVHKSNPVKSLTQKQLAGILAGRIKNWKEVGGKNAPIVVMAEQEGGGARSMVEKTLLYGGDIRATLKEADNGAADVPPMVAKDPNALGITMEAKSNSIVNKLRTDKAIQQPLILVTIGEPAPNLAKVIDAAQTAGFF